MTLTKTKERTVKKENEIGNGREKRVQACFFQVILLLYVNKLLVKRKEKKMSSVR